MASLLSLPPSTSYFLNDDSSFPALIFPKRHNQRSLNHKNIRYCTIKCRRARAKESPSTRPATLVKEPHKYFDQVIITVRQETEAMVLSSIYPTGELAATSRKESAITRRKQGRKVFAKRDFDGSLILPTGGHGGDVVIYADERRDSSLEFHTKSRYNAKRGSNVYVMGVLASQSQNGLSAPTLCIPVPVGLHVN